MSKIFKILSIILVVLVLFIASLLFFVQPAGNNGVVNTNQAGGALEDEKQQIEPLETTPNEAEQEAKQIEDWIKANNLNRYGDPIDFMYTGGSPLFNEQTGEVTGRYDYILENHPDTPWLE